MKFYENLLSGYQIVAFNQKARHWETNRHFFVVNIRWELSPKRIFVSKIFDVIIARGVEF
jgi:hypothetical protein